MVMSIGEGLAPATVQVYGYTDTLFSRLSSPQIDATHVCVAMKLYRRFRLECEAGQPEDFRSGEWEECRTEPCWDGSPTSGRLEEQQHPCGLSFHLRREQLQRSTTTVLMRWCRSGRQRLGSCKRVPRAVRCADRRASVACRPATEPAACPASSFRTDSAACVPTVTRAAGRPSDRSTPRGAPEQDTP